MSIIERRKDPDVPAPLQPVCSRCPECGIRFPNLLDGCCVRCLAEGKRVVLDGQATIRNPANSYKELSESDKQFIRDHYREMSSREIARALNIKAVAVETLKRKEKLRKRPEQTRKIQQQTMEAKRRVDAGESIARIAESLGLSQQTLHIRMKRWGLL